MVVEELCRRLGWESELAVVLEQSFGFVEAEAAESFEKAEKTEKLQKAGGVRIEQDEDGHCFRFSRLEIET